MSGTAAVTLEELAAEFPSWRFRRVSGWSGPRWEASRAGAACREGVCVLIAASPAELQFELDQAIVLDAVRLAAAFPHVALGLVTGRRRRRVLEAAVYEPGGGLVSVLRTADAAELARELALMPGGP